MGIIDTVFYLEGAQKVFPQDHPLTSANVKLTSQKIHFREQRVPVNNIPCVYYSSLHLVFSPVSVHTAHKLFKTLTFYCVLT